MRLKLDHVYAIAKSFGIKGQLLPFSYLEELAESRSVDEYVDKLRITPYGQHLAELRKPYDQLAIEKALKKHVIDVHYRIVNVVPRAELLSVYFYRYIASDTKAVLRAKAMGRSFEEIQQGLDLYAEELLGVRDEVVRAAAAASLEEAVEELKRTFLEPDVTLAYRIWEEKKDLSALDSAVDKAFYTKLLKAFKKTPRGSRKDLKEFIALEIDGYQILTLLRAKTWGLPAPQTRELLLEEQISITRDFVDEALEVESLGDVIQLLSNTPYRRLVAGEAEGVAAISTLEEAFRKELYRKASKIFKTKPFSLAVILATVLLKELEARNLTTIAIGLVEGLQPSVILQNLWRV